MSWYDPTSWFDQSDSSHLRDQATARYDQTGQPLPWNVNDYDRKNLLAQQAALGGKFADQAQQNYTQYGQQGNAALAGLQAQAQGQNSVSAMQLQQGLQENLAAQRSLAASASPQNSAMAARTAAIQSGRLGAGLAGQQAVAGLQERNQAQAQYGNLLGNLRGQELNAATNSRATAANAYGAGAAGTPTPSWWDKHGSEVEGGAAGLASALSDRRLKTDVRDGDAAATQIASALPAATFRYNDQRNGAGTQLGVMAQDLQGLGLGQAVVDTPHGKVVNGAKLATANTAMIGALARRLSQVEQTAQPTAAAPSDDYGASDAPSPSLVRRRAAAYAQMMAQRQAAQTAREQALMRRAQTAPIPYTSAIGRSWGADASAGNADMGGE